MKRAARRPEQALAAAVIATCAAFCVMVFAIGDPLRFPSGYASSAVLLGVVATRVLSQSDGWNAWWIPTLDLSTTSDMPAQLLATAVRALPQDRRDWGAAMEAEQAHVPNLSGRWRFAFGCARTALLSSLNSRAPGLRVGLPWLWWVSG